MKAALPILLILAFNTFTLAQTDIPKQTICPISEIPLLIESEATIYTFDQKGNFKTGAGRIRIWNIGRQQPIEFDHLLQMGKPLPLEQKIGLNAFPQLDNNHLSEISNLKWNENFLILDTTITAKQELIINWKNRNNKLLQSIRFFCEPVIPVILGIRLAQTVDSIDQAHKARQIKRINTIPRGFKNVIGNAIFMDAGSHLELKLKSFSLLTDSAIQFRLSKTGEDIPVKWITSGHVLTLPNLKSGSQYKLELKYMGQNLINTYTLNIKPFWYQLLWVRLSAICALIILSILTTRWYYRRKIRLISAQRQRLEEQLTTIQSQLNPHFIFNALSSIEGLVSTGENKLANEYLTTFSLIMRETLKNTDKMLISLKEEIALLEKYISIEELRFGFNCNMRISPEIRADEIQVPPMLAQPLIENAVKHGAAGGMLIVAIEKNENDMVIAVTNNKALHKMDQQTAGGYGLTFTEQRLKHFSALNPETPILFSFIEHESTVEARLTFINWFA